MELKKLCITFIPWDIASNGPRESTLEREKKRKSLHKTFRRVMEGKLLFFLLFFSSLFSPSFFSCGSGVHWRKKKESLQDQREREGKKWLFSKTLAEEWRKLLLSPLESGRGNQCWRQRLFKKILTSPSLKKKAGTFSLLPPMSNIDAGIELWIGNLSKICFKRTLCYFSSRKSTFSSLRFLKMAILSLMGK